MEQDILKLFPERYSCAMDRAQSAPLNLWEIFCCGPAPIHLPPPAEEISGFWLQVGKELATKG